MRYDDWDVLLFPSGRDDRVPLREFKVNCHVVPDADFSHSRATFGLPVMTCFVPGLQSGSPFHISIHSWCRPKPSQHTLSYTKHPELATFEARIFIDGRMVASTLLQPFGAWPNLIASTSQMTKQGELEELRFPSFRRELLFQNHWSPGDDLGRIKVLIGEGFPRDSPSNPIERVKNVVAFAFQHAPLDILETNGIAWPNPQMWRRPQNNPALPVPTFYPDDGADSHLHSPRRRPLASQHMPTISTTLTAPAGPVPTLDAITTGRSNLQKASASTASSFLDPFNEAAYQEWIDSLGLEQQQSHVNTSAIWPTLVARGNDRSGANPAAGSIMAYMPSAVRDTATADPVHLSGRSLDEDTQMDMLKVPTNTPTAFLGADHAASGQFTCNNPNPPMSTDFAHTLTHSLLNQPQPLPVLPQSIQAHQIQLPASEVKSRKENRHVNNAGSVGSSTNPSPSVEAQTRRFSASNTAFGIIGNDRTTSSGSGSGPTFSRHSSAGDFGKDITNTASPGQTYAGVAASGNGHGSGSEKGTKRSRNFTPASAKAIDEEDEPRRVSPRLRAATIFSLNSDDNETQQ
ncbi:hypothetical protein KVR01_013329 [Diaporthe batatas]|uniref:uncharacterized protein n=1 Tax=Diaporthe batatas TaxID=748121 RepID=UPI001D05AEF7|nr:uncharacterized protein KVR01_013329 [Diaporthe batatas]KAG8156724.1 hypothetical protein KVR01_013329 [Diaporthe batatas]